MHTRQSRFALVASTFLITALSAAVGAAQLKERAYHVTIGDAIGIHQPTALPSSTPQASLRSGESVPTRPMTLGTVRIPRSVKANDQPLPRGTYQVRLMGDPLKPAVGETPGLEQWVEFLQHGTVKGKAVASVVPSDEIHQVEKERSPRPGRVRADLLSGNDYVRVWFNKGGNHYLIHLPR